MWDKTPLLDKILLRPNCVPLANIFQIIKPNNKKRGKYSICDLKIFVNTTYNTNRSKSGSRKVQKNPKMELRYRNFKSITAKSQINVFLFQNVLWSSIRLVQF